MIEVYRKPARVIVLKSENDVREAKETLWLALTLMENHLKDVCEKGDGELIKVAVAARSNLRELLNATGTPGDE